MNDNRCPHTPAECPLVDVTADTAIRECRKEART